MGDEFAGDGQIQRQHLPDRGERGGNDAPFQRFGLKYPPWETLRVRDDLQRGARVFRIHTFPALHEFTRGKVETVIVLMSLVRSTRCERVDDTRSSLAVDKSVEMGVSTMRP